MIHFEQVYLINQSQPQDNPSLVNEIMTFVHLVIAAYTTNTSGYVNFAISTITIGSYQKLDCTQLEIILFHGGEGVAQTF